MYCWRKLNQDEQRAIVSWRQGHARPLHSPHHLDSGQRHYLITGACFEHAAHIGHSISRMNDFTGEWLKLIQQHSASIQAWVVLPNHYHALISTANVLDLLKSLGRLHGSTSFHWNGEEAKRGRQVWCKAVETVMKSSDHSWATLNYVHHNPVKHGYVAKWTEWPWSSAKEYLQQTGRDEATRLWNRYPVTSFGEGWDDAAL